MRVARTVAKLTPSPKVKKPLKTEHLLLIEKITPRTFVGIRNFFMILLMMVAMLRECEAMALKTADVWLELVDGELCLFVFVEMSKTDQCRNGHTIVLGASQLASICPISWFIIYSFSRDINAVFFFHAKKGSKKSVESKLSTSTPWHKVKQFISSIGEDPKLYGSHSCRRGGVTAAVANNVNTLLIARHGNWKSDAVFGYISDSISRKLSVSKAILS